MGESQERSDCIPGQLKTVSGKHITLPHSEENVFDIRDIAHALSKICRFNGHIDRFYSVAHHSVFCWTLSFRGTTREERRHILLHDAHEAYICDVPTPLKMILPDYKELETTLAYDLAKAFHFTRSYSKSQELVKSIDSRAYLAERAVLGRSSLTGSEDEKALKRLLDMDLNIQDEFLLTYEALSYYEGEPK